MSKSNIEFLKEEDFFYFNDDKITFESISAIYFKITEHSTNRVYERRELELTLELQNKIQIKLLADTKKLEQYKTLELLQEAITAYRYKKLHLRYISGDTLLFNLKHEEYDFIFGDKKLFVKYNRAKRPNSVDFEVKFIKQDGYILELKGDEEVEKTATWLLSDRELFIKLAQEMVEYITPFEIFKKKMILEEKLTKYFFILFIPFGINGLSELYFKTSLLKHTEPFATLSFIAGIILAISLLTMPSYMLVYKLNARKKQYERDILSGRKSSVKELDFTNLLLIVLVGGLAWMLFY